MDLSSLANFESLYLPRDEKTIYQTALAAVDASKSSVSDASQSVSSRRSVSSNSSSTCINDLVSTPVLNTVCALDQKGGRASLSQNCDDAAMMLMSLQKKN